jgi:hypothetical protein
MATVPSGTRFIGIATSVDLTERKSAVLNKTTEPFTIEDIASTVGVGATGPQGVQGPAGPLGPVGPAGLEWQGAWVSGTSYVADDAVGYDGASWFCILATSGTTTPDLDATHWALLASQGAQGIQGVQGPTGAQGAAGNTALQNYKSYVALISQSGTSNPTATVVFNDTLATFTWSYDDVGSYFVTCSSPMLLSGKTVVFVTTQGNSGNGQNKIFGGARTNNSNVGLNTSSNGILDLNLEIRVYN